MIPRIIPVFKPLVFYVYARITDEGLVTSIYSTSVKHPKSPDILIKYGTGDEYAHVGYYNILTDDGLYKYKVNYDNDKYELVERTTVELEEERNKK